MVLSDTLYNRMVPVKHPLVCLVLSVSLAYASVRYSNPDSRGRKRCVMRLEMFTDTVAGSLECPMFVENQSLVNSSILFAAATGAGAGVSLPGASPGASSKGGGALRSRRP